MAGNDEGDGRRRRSWRRSRNGCARSASRKPRRRPPCFLVVVVSVDFVVVFVAGQLGFELRRGPGSKRGRERRATRHWRRQQPRGNGDRRRRRRSCEESTKSRYAPLFLVVQKQPRHTPQFGARGARGGVRGRGGGQEGKSGCVSPGAKAAAGGLRVGQVCGHVVRLNARRLKCRDMSASALQRARVEHAFRSQGVGRHLVCGRGERRVDRRPGKSEDQRGRCGAGKALGRVRRREGCEGGRRSWQGQRVAAPRPK
mmetsp:Transcript_61829/g.123935  ORF Transcript_61829/g.123935 Transcript_61829/m.123935 type:complete len:256 (+) Transcript_61829:277-1044(+)